MIQVTIPTSEYKAIEQSSKYRFTVHYDATTEDELTNCKEETITVDKADYSHLVSAIIGIKYSKDDEIALINNYITDANFYKDEYTEYLQWRTAAKLISSEFLNESVLS